MDTRHTHHDRIDAELEAMLDHALAPEPAPPGLTDRIVAATAPRLRSPGRRAHRDGVLARLGPAVLGLAAAVALSGAAALYVATLRQQVGPATIDRASAFLVAATGHAATSGPSDFSLDAPPGTDLDTRITLLALQFELVDSRELWAPPSDGIADAALAAELESFADPAMFF